MEVIDPFQMNDWTIKKFIIITFSIQISIIALLLLDQFNLEIPILRPLLSFIFITFIPGVTLLRIFKQHELGSVKTVLYSFGLSLSFLMFTGFFLNIIGPFFGFLNPFTVQNVLLIINASIVFLIILSYLRDRNYSKFEPKINLNFSEIWKICLVCLLPFLAIFSTYLFNYYGNNFLQMFLLLILSLVPILLVFNRIPKHFLPISIYIVSLALLFYTALISPYVLGSDINKELVIIRSILENSRLDLALSETINSMLSISSLAPIYSLVLNLSPVFILKVIYPVLFAFVPLGLFEVYREQMNTKDAFLSVFFFISVFTFFTTMLALARQQIAEIFFVLLILLVVDIKLDKTIKSFLLIVFGSSMAVSHYGISYLFLLILGVSFVYILINKKRRENVRNYDLINYGVPIFLLVFIISWYMYLASSSSLESGVFVSKTIYSSITDLFNPQTSTALNIATAKLPFLQRIDRNLYLVAEFFVLIGLLGTLIRNKKDFIPEFKILAIGTLAISVISIAVPKFSAALNTDRIIHISFFLLSPFLIIGIKNCLEILNKLFKNHYKLNLKNYQKYALIFLVLFFLLNTSFLYQIIDQDKLGRFALDKSSDYMVMNGMEISAINWYNHSGNNNSEIYADVYKQRMIYGLKFNIYEKDMTKTISMYYAENFTENNDPNSRIEILNSFIKDGNYVFLGSFNIKNEKMRINSRRDYLDYTKSRYVYIPISDFNAVFDKIYDNGFSNLLYT